MVGCNKLEKDIGWNATGRGGAVAAGGKEATRAGISILEQGGNAADAAAATLLALSITDFGYFVIGAEVPLIIYDAEKKEVKVLSGQGAAPLDSAAMGWYYENEIPVDGGMKAAPVPGALSLCMTLLKLYGTMSFEQVVGPSLALLDTSKLEWHPNLAKTFRKLIETERETTGAREEKLQAARDRFYRGDIADDLEAFYIREGSFLRKKDLAAHVTRVEDPVKVDYRGYTVYKCGPWTQGPFLCQTLRLLEGFDLKGMGNLSADYIHVLSEAMKLGFADRDEYYADPEFVEVPMEMLLSDEYTRLRSPLIDISSASQEVRPGDPINMKAVKASNYFQTGIGGTTTCLVADRWGNMVAATPSGNPPYSIDMVTGIPHGNRLRQLNTTQGHPNRIEPGKRPRITLTPTLVLKDGKPVIAISVAGGDLQDQTTLICLLNYIEFGMLPENAVLSPRFSTNLYQNSFDPNPNRGELLEKNTGLSLEDEIEEEIIDELKKRGHEVNIFSGANSHPVMLYVDPETGMMHAAGDHRVGRHAAILETASITGN
jgi:gamma-glutamyltranspeptidase/glutathione hydrolase